MVIAIIIILVFKLKSIMLRKEKGKECSLSLRILSPTEENKQGHQVTLSPSEEEELSLGRASRAVQSLDRHRDRVDYKVPFVQLLQSPRREELSLKSPLDSGFHVSILVINQCI